jgi:hypothetical protein
VPSGARYTASATSRWVPGKNDVVPAYSSVSPVLVGRDTQVGALAGALRRVQDEGDARVVLISGPAGMGKSRLVAEAQRLAAQGLLARLEGQCVPDAGVPYVALVSALRRRTRGMVPAELAENGARSPSSGRWPTPASRSAPACTPVSARSPAASSPA